MTPHYDQSPPQRRYAKPKLALLGDSLFPGTPELICGFRADAFNATEFATATSLETAADWMNA